MRNIKTPPDKQNMSSSHYVRALIETIREPFLILDSDLRVVEANKAFYVAFEVNKKETEKRLVYKLGNGQWDIPALKKLLENILPSKKVVRNYEVTHNFPSIGVKIMLLNANQIDSAQLILLAFEDVTARKDLENKLKDTSKALAVKVAERTQQLSARVQELEEMNKSMVGRELKMVELKKQIEALKKKR